MISRSVRLVIFDLAGTTVKIPVDITKVFRDAFQAHDVRLSEESLIPYRGASKREAVAGLLSAMGVEGIDPTTIYNTFQRQLLKELADGEIRPMAGVEAALCTLQAARVRVVLATGFDGVVAAYVLDCLDWRNQVDAVVTDDDVAEGRPAPDVVLEGMRSANVKAKDQVVVVGDTVNDIEAGRRAGVGAVVAVLTGAHDRERLATANPTTILPSAADVLEWLGLSPLEETF